MAQRKQRERPAQPPFGQQQQILPEYQAGIRYLNNAIGAINNLVEFLRLTNEQLLQLNANEIRKRQSLTEVAEKYDKAQEKKQEKPKKP